MLRMMNTVEGHDQEGDAQTGDDGTDDENGQIWHDFYLPQS